jgi:hypothetical protein
MNNWKSMLKADQTKMNPYEEKIKQYIQDSHLPAEHISFPTSFYSVEDAARSVHTSTLEFPPLVIQLLF